MLNKLKSTIASAVVFTAALEVFPATAADLNNDELVALQNAIIARVDDQAKMAQVMNDTIFSFGELGFQEFETAAYLIGMLEENGFAVEESISGIPTAFMATWGEGEPVIALGSDFDGIPKSSQKPGVAYHDPIIEGAPGHGEGHNSGNVVNIIAALAVKEVMEREGIPGTIKIWPGVAEEQLATKAYFVRDGYFEDVDAVLFSHVSNSLGTSWGGGRGNGLVSIRYEFSGESAHSAGAPWRGKSAADAVDLMSIGINFRREHLRLSQRIHSVVVDGGDQPNVVPSKASIWYFLRETDFEHIKGLWDMADDMAEGAALMTQTEWTSTVLGTAWPQHMNKPMAERSFSYARMVGMPEWSEDDIALAKAVQAELGVEQEGLNTELREMSEPPDPSTNTGGGSDDIGDISWNVPTITLRYPSNIPNLPGHNWSNGIAMATPIAHKGIVAGAKVQALTLLDLITDDQLLADAWDYFNTVQNKDMTYVPLLRPQDEPAIDLNREIMSTWRPVMEEYYYDASKYDSYMEQLGIEYPTTR